MPQAAGSATDNIARIMAPALAEELGQSVVVDNRPGGALTIGIDAVAKAAPDGYTLGQGPVGALAITRHMVAKLPDIERDLQPVALVHYRLHASRRLAEDDFHSVKDLIEFARKNPGSSPCLVEQRLARARERRTVQAHDRHRHRAYPVQGRRASSCGPHRGQRAAHVREHQLDRAACQGGPGARAGRYGRAALGILPESRPSSRRVPGYEVNAWSGIAAGVPRPVLDKLNAAVNQRCSSPTPRSAWRSSAAKAAAAPGSRSPS